MPPTCVYEQRSFAPFPIAYSSENFAPLVRENRQISHVQYLLQGQHASLACFHHYLTTFSTIFSLEQTLQELQDNQDHVFVEFIAADNIHQLQPFLVQTHHHMHAPISIATTTDTNLIQLRPASQQDRRRTPLVTQIPHTHHDNTPLPITNLVVVCIPTPIPPTSTSTTRYISPLVIQFNPCASCGSADGHLPGCTA